MQSGLTSFINWKNAEEKNLYNYILTFVYDFTLLICIIFTMLYSVRFLHPYTPWVCNGPSNCSSTASYMYIYICHHHLVTARHSYLTKPTKFWVNKQIVQDVTSNHVRGFQQFSSRRPVVEDCFQF